MINRRCHRVVLFLVVGGLLALPGPGGALVGHASAQTSLQDGATSGAPDECGVAPGNLLSYEQSTVESSIEEWAATNATLAQSSSHAVDGTHSLAITAEARAGDASAAAGGATAEARRYYAGQAQISTGKIREGDVEQVRPVQLSLMWQDSKGAVVGSSSGAPTTPTEEWATLSVTGRAPAGTASAALVLTMLEASRGQILYADAAMLEEGKEASAWVAGNGSQADCDGGNNGGNNGGNDSGDIDGGNNGGNDSGGNDSGGNDSGGNNGGNNGGNDSGGNNGGNNGGNDGGNDAAPPEELPTGADTAGDKPQTNDSKSPPGGRAGPGSTKPPPSIGGSGFEITGSYSTDALMATAIRLRSLGWGRAAVAQKVFAPFIVGGEASWINTWGAPRSGGRSHEGQDVFCNYGAPVLASEAGVVEFDHGGLGGIVARLRRPDGSYYYYAHLSGWNNERFSSGDAVQTGDVIGYCGNSGNALTTPPHVHFGFYGADGVAKDPMAALVKWLQSAERRNLGYVTEITLRRVERVEQLTSARRFGDAFTPAPSDREATRDLYAYLFESATDMPLSMLQTMLIEGFELPGPGASTSDSTTRYFETWLNDQTLPLQLQGADFLE